MPKRTSPFDQKQTLCIQLGKLRTHTQTDWNGKDNFQFEDEDDITSDYQF